MCNLYLFGFILQKNAPNSDSEEENTDPQSGNKQVCKSTFSLQTITSTSVPVTG